jgi:hypothetical protein
MKLKLLEDLKISQTKITESGFLALKKAFPNCTVHWAATPP